jgi:SAM-dependent methyltransferase
MAETPPPSGSPASAKIDMKRPHPARMWNYWLGGKDNFQIDREVGDQVVAAHPGILRVALASRACLGRMVSYLAAEEGLRQFLDIGTGLPTEGNTHEVAQRIASDSKVVYVDNDPLVLTHARALLASGPEGACGYIDCDVRDPGRILDEAGEVLDFTRPVGLVMFGIMGNVVDDDEAAAIVRRLVGALVPGGFLALNDGTGQVDEQGRQEALRIAVEQGSSPYVARTPDQIASFFEGLELIEPGVVSTSLWRTETSSSGTPREVDATCGLARKR